MKGTQKEKVKLIENVIKQWNDGLIPDQELADGIFNIVHGPLPVIFEVDVITRGRRIATYLVQGVKNAEDAIDHLMWLNDKEVKELGAPLWDSKSMSYKLFAEPIEFVNNVCDI